MPSWLQGVLNTCPLAAKFKGERLPIPPELRQLPYFEKRFKNKYAHLYKAHDERGLKCPMDVKTMEDMVSFCQHVLRSDDILASTKDVARVFLARVLNVYNAQHPVPGVMDEDVFDKEGNLKHEAAKPAQTQAATDEVVQEKQPAPALRPEQAEQLEVAAVRLSAEQDRRRMRRLERHIVKLEARLTLLEPDSDADSQSPVNTGAAKPSLDVPREKERDRFGKELVVGAGGLARAGSTATSGAHNRTPSSGVGGNGGLTRAGSGATANSHGNGTVKDKEARDKEQRDKPERDIMRDKDLREAKVLLREVPVLKKLGRGTPPPPLRTPPQLRTPPPVVR
ncbi:hypothetical protein CC85DRAFT_314781 [Cutaneotrichosporon oleaginosum]|uniref:Uncharacterized protein n=1 Tax=Cutaneotrichosporon oleaginosum TaxID=879819 RepID=A0A0J0XZV3_9TREE|nr:uncharacterized protein CC85DRAFT_314781 [Cutaneotrichosporon oleaginosum]KLT46563.1 hypothetical protein CC85DRAFT_314781 [Cutaneotrichosporon oleaginosum]TXT15072.1 hypothetical protein COLE_01265 [Cutaneotrichosporon oleaginosum]